MRKRTADSQPKKQSSSEELRVDAAYRNTNDWKQPQDVFNRFFRFTDGKGINNTSGFRPKSKVAAESDILHCAFCVLVTNFGETEWPDSLDYENGIFTYYGDNRSPGRRIDETRVGGNRLLQHVFSLLHVGRRSEIPPFLCFEKYKNDQGTQMRFLGLACPGGQRFSSLEDLVAVWRVKDATRFQNYRAIFTILREETVSHAWLQDLVQNTASANSLHCPETWRKWVNLGTYTPLKCSRQATPRTRQQQLPQSAAERRVLEQVIRELSDREFEYFAAELVQLMDDRFTNVTVTRAVRDGGRDVISNYRVGHDLHQVMLNAYIEAKQWKTDSAVGVKPMMRLIARLKHRDVGVFVTTSYFEQQVQEELIEDRHPVLLISGGDIARLLIQAELGSPGTENKLNEWLEGIRRRAQEVQNP